MEIYYPNTTQVSNFVLDNQNLFTDGELRVLLVITRKTIGWHKETDFIRYAQLIEITGKSKPTISEAVNSLVAKGLIERVDKDGTPIKVMPQGYRGEIFYTLNKQLVKNLNQLKILTSTGKKSLPYKTNSNKTKLIGKPKKDKSLKNVDNNVDNHQHAFLVPKAHAKVSPNTGMVSLVDLMQARAQESVRVLDDHSYSDPVKTAHQAYGLEVVEKLQLSDEYKARIMAACKNKALHRIEYAVKATLKKGVQLNADERANYFFKVLHSNR